MFHPVGSQPPSVYWRRRFLILATLVVLLLLVVLTVRAMTSGANGSPRSGAAAAGPTHRTGSPASSPTPRSPSHRTHPSRRSRSSSAGTAMQDSSSHRRTGSATGRSSKRPKRSAAASTSAPPPPPCRPDQLSVQAYTPQTTYHVGDKPVVELEVTDTGSQPCVQDLADKQVVLKVYNGVSRVWGSHDCETQPGTDDRVLAVGQSVRVSVVWSGFTSQPGCTTTRQRVGAGEYTLYAWLSGHEGKATQFSIV